MLFVPVARPTRRRGAAGRGGPDLPPDDRPLYAIRQENVHLQDENIKLPHDLEDLRRINGEHEKYGDLRSLCTPLKVVGNEPGPHESLAVQGSSLEGLRDGMYVVYPGQIVGTLRSGVGGGRVELITNPGKRVEAYFAGLRPAEKIRPPTPRPSPSSGPSASTRGGCWSRAPASGRCCTPC